MIVAAGGEQQAQRGFTRALPFIMGILLFMGVMIGGQTLMTSTIEEKSSRVVEVLLAAVSPFELMAGKLLGQLAVGLLVMGVYIGLGLLGAVPVRDARAARSDARRLPDRVLPHHLPGVRRADVAIGAAVNQMADAQSLMGPVMLLLIAPYILTPMIGRAPNSTFSVAVSFIPPVNTFAMMARLASDSPPPAWQVWLTVARRARRPRARAVWFAAKVFKIGLLMHGKPPNFATLIRWARAAEAIPDAGHDGTRAIGGTESGGTEWRSGSGHPATTIRSGRAASIRRSCRRRRCCRTTPSGFRRSRSTTRSTARRTRRSSTAGTRRRRSASS